MPLTTTTGSTTVSTTEVVLAEYATEKERLVDFKVDLSPMAAGDTFKVRVYVRMVSAGAWVLFADDVFVDAQAIPVIYYPMITAKFGARLAMIKTAGLDRTFTWQTAELT